MSEHCHHSVTDECGIEDACGAEVVTTRYDETWGHYYPVCAEHCPHLATVTGAAVITERRLCQSESVTHWRPDPGGLTVCLTCHTFQPEPEEPA